LADTDHDHSKITPGEAAHGHGGIADLRDKNRKQLITVIGLSGSFMIAELIVGFSTHSLAVLADAGHMLGDVAAIALALIASFFATKSATSEKTFGYYRTEILASTINAMGMLGMSGFIMYEAIRRFSNSTEVPGMPMVVIGLIGGVINLISMRLLSGSAEHSLNTKAAYLEVFSDMLASFAVVVAGLVIQFTAWHQIDSIVSMLIAIALIPRTWGLLMQCVHVLMEGTPDHIAVNDLRKSILSVKGVKELHDLHVWTITSGMDSLSAHVVIAEGFKTQEVLNEIAQLCQHDYSINHTTIQVEEVECEGTQCQQ
jgi:cobalt-zinc-cadmium efflux system protein